MTEKDYMRFINGDDGNLVQVCFTASQCILKFHEWHIYFDRQSTLETTGTKLPVYTENGVDLLVHLIGSAITNLQEKNNILLIGFADHTVIYTKNHKVLTVKELEAQENDNNTLENNLKLLFSPK